MAGKKGGLMDQLGLNEAKPIQMGMMALLGYLLGNGLNESGLPMAAYNAIPTYRAFVDKMYAANEATGLPQVWGSGGGVGIMKLAGGLVAAKAGYDSYEAGRIKTRDLNTSFPFAIGAILDPPNSKGQGYTTPGTPAGAQYGGGMGGWI